MWCIDDGDTTYNARKSVISHWCCVWCRNLKILLGILWTTGLAKRILRDSCIMPRHTHISSRGECKSTNPLETLRVGSPFSSSWSGKLLVQVQNKGQEKAWFGEEKSHLYEMASHCCSDYFLHLSSAKYISYGVCEVFVSIFEEDI